MMAEACGNRTHLARVRRHADFEDQEGHQAQSASTLILRGITGRALGGGRLLCFCCARQEIHGPAALVSPDEDAAAGRLHDLWPSNS